MCGADSPTSFSTQTKMTIKIDNYLIEQEPAGILQWNIYKVYTVQAGKTAGNVNKVNVAWGVTLPRAVEIVISDALMDDLSEVTLLDYLIEYRFQTERMTKEITKQLKQ